MTKHKEKWLVESQEDVEYELSCNGKVVAAWTHWETVKVAETANPIKALNAALNHVNGEWEDAAGGYMYIHHEGFELNPLDVVDYLILCYLHKRDLKLADMLQSKDGQIVYGCAPTGLDYRHVESYETALDLFRYKTGLDFRGRHYGYPGPLYYPRRPRLEELVWLNEHNMPDLEESEEDD